MIANPPNSARVGSRKVTFDDGAISRFGLAIVATSPTMVAIAAFLPG